ncbi:ADAMTS-like protein 5 [Oratosquilla oratoria]|uniref:ADAMTS-like protein 5 n=1 Tax=Oratosquilla oratoria TaxID=337810 RepID=UPI003F75CF5E
MRVRRGGHGVRSSEVVNSVTSKKTLCLLTLVMVSLVSLELAHASQEPPQRYRRGTSFIRRQFMTSRRRSGSPAYYWSRTRHSWTHYSQRPTHIGPLPHVNRVMSEWSNWSNWGRCSRSCGGGVRLRTRSCVTRYPRVMPGSGVRTSHNRCAGESVEYGVCGTAACPRGHLSVLSFKASQCRRYNKRRVFGRIVNSWVPYTHDGINPCELACEGEGVGIVYTFGKVTDGTQCRIPEEDMEEEEEEEEEEDVIRRTRNREGLCVNGRCLRVSCDGRLGSGFSEDKCRVCGGHNESCTRHSGVFRSDILPRGHPSKMAALRSPVSSSPSMLRSRDQHQPTPRALGYHEVAFIPRGSTNIKAVDQSPNFLALKSGNKYILNGDWLINWPGDLSAAGTSFSYSRAHDESEKLFALGPTTEDLTLMVLLRESNPGVYYEYWTPKTPFLAPPQVKSSNNRLPTTSSRDFSPPHTLSSIHRHSSTTSRPPTVPTIASFRQFLPSGHDRSEEDSRKRTTFDLGPEDNLLPRPEAPPRPPPRPWSSPGEGGVPPLPRTGGSGGGRPSSTTSLGSSPSGSSLTVISSESRPQEDPMGSGQRGESGRKDKAKESWERKGKKKRKKKKKKTSKEEEEEEEEGLGCKPCERIKKTKESFCTSDFVSRVQVESSEVLGSEHRHVVFIQQSYKNTVPLLHKEFLWVDNACGCPRLRPGRTYLLMGRTDTSRGGREIRLVIGRGSYVRRFKPRALAKILRMRRDELRHCRPWRRNLRFRQKEDEEEEEEEEQSNDVLLTANSESYSLVT